MTYDERFEVVNYLRGVTSVILQDTPDYRPNLMTLRPQFVVHGNDWSDEARQAVLEVIKDWDGKLIETDYFASPTSSTIIKKRVID
jgi:glycerol-3-phosphate cytidylyltransferase-like family protein